MGTIDYKKIADERRAGWRDATSGKNKSFENLLTGLYSENNHFIYELLQNAEDEEATFLTFVYQKDRLLAFHDGRPFNEKDVWGICSVMDGTKRREDAQKIGHFGVGFKSVFKYTARPEIYSNGEAFAIENILLPVAIPMDGDPADCTYQLDGRTMRPFDGKKNYTKFVLPFKDRAELCRSGIDPDDIPRKLRELEPEILLFLRHVETFAWTDETTGDYGVYQRMPAPEEEKICTCRKQYVENGRGAETQSQKYLVFEERFDCDSMANACVKVAFALEKAIKPVKNTKMWVFFPTTDESGLNFLLHGTYQTPISREKLISDSEFNEMLHGKAEDLIVRSLEELRDRGLVTQSFLREILLPAFRSPYLTGLKEKVTGAFRTGRLLPAYAGKAYLTVSQARLAIPYHLPGIVEKELLCRAIGADSDFAAFSDVSGNRGKEYYCWLRDDLQVARWTAFDLARLLPEALGDITGGSPGLFAFLKSVTDEYKISTWGNRNEAYYYDFQKACDISLWNTLKTKALIPNQAGALASAWRGNRRNLYLQGNSGGPELPAEKLAALGKLLPEEEKSGGQTVSEEDIRSLLTRYFDIAVYDHAQYVRENIYPKYSGALVNVTPEEHIKDIQQILQIPVSEIDRDIPFLRAKEGNSERVFYVQPNHSALYFEQDADGVSIKEYFSWLPGKHYFVDLSFYAERGISREMLTRFRTGDSLLLRGSERRGGPCTGRREQQLGYDGRSTWHCNRKFWYKLSLVQLEEALQYIARDPNSDRAREKSKIIFQVLRNNEEHLRGSLTFSSGRTMENQVCDAISILSEKKWLFTAAGEWVEPSEISQLELDPELYEMLPYDSQLYQSLGFQKNERDITRLCGDLHKIPTEILKAELQRRQGQQPQTEEERGWEFPWQPVRDMDRLRKHVQMQYALSTETRYEYVMRRMRVTGNDSKAYLKSMYERDGAYACQLCHTPVSKINVEAVELELTPLREVEQMHLCLCSSCANRYRAIRREEAVVSRVKQRIQEQNANRTDGPIRIPLENVGVLLFSPIHLAEIQILLKLEEEQSPNN